MFLDPLASRPMRRWQSSQLKTRAPPKLFLMKPHLVQVSFCCVPLFFKLLILESLAKKRSGLTGGSQGTQAAADSPEDKGLNPSKAACPGLFRSFPGLSKSFPWA